MDEALADLRPDGEQADLESSDDDYIGLSETPASARPIVKTNTLELRMVYRGQLRQYALHVSREQTQYKVSFAGKDCEVTATGTSQRLICLRIRTPPAGASDSGNTLLNLVLADRLIMVWAPGCGGKCVHCNESGCLELKDYADREAFSVFERIVRVFQKLRCKLKGGCGKVSRIAVN